MHKFLFSICIVLLSAALSDAKIQTEAVQYRDGDMVLEGYLAYDDSIKGKRPGVMVVHEWWGLNDYVKNRAEQLAALGYVAFAADIYGKGIRANNADEAGKLAGMYRKDRNLLRSRANSGLDALKKNELADPERLAAIGYCFGGGTVLELARSGADIKGVVSFHGTLDNPNPADAKKIKAEVLVLHGALDPYVKPDDVLSFWKEMNGTDAIWQINVYSSAVHSFTNPASGNDPSKGIAYNEMADKGSWEAMKLFFSRIFK